MPRGRIGAVGGGGGSPEDWFKSLPPVSRILFVSILGTTLLEVVGVLSAYHYMLAWPLVWNKFQVWRFFTSAVYHGPPSFHFLMSLMITTQYSIRYEKDPFTTGGGGGSADYAWMLILCGFALVTLSVVFFAIPFLGNSLTFLIVYVWSRKTPDTPVSFWGISVKSVYIPWVMVAFHLLTGQSIFNPLLGIGVGHLYYFLVDILPDTHNVDLVHTPNFLVDLLGYGQEGSGVTMQAPAGGGMRGPGQVPAQRGFPRPGGGHSWGSGRPLGAQ